MSSDSRWRWVSSRRRVAGRDFRVTRATPGIPERARARAARRGPREAPPARQPSAARAAAERRCARMRRGCDDGKACTLDICNELGVCENPPKCGEDEPFCCAGGVCGQCCTPADCADASDCTTDDCFAGFCSHTPTACPNPTTQYCSETGCKDREQCTDAAGCDDQQPCTTDRCVDGLCAHDGCGAGESCCENGCAECCSDSQCKGDDDELCEPAVCRNGACTTDALCPASGTQCCERSNGTADCGSSECCTTDDCPHRLCMRKLCTPTGCEYDAIAGDCGPGMRCEPDVGCVPTDECVTAEDCDPPADLCQERRCTNGQVRVRERLHATARRVVPGLAADECCSNVQCQQGADTGKPYCCGDNTCGACCTGVRLRERRRRHHHSHVADDRYRHALHHLPVHRRTHVYRRHDDDLQDRDDVLSRPRVHSALAVPAVGRTLPIGRRAYLR